jgi:hypothetical protein
VAGWQVSAKRIPLSVPLAQKATKEHQEEHGEWDACGFAWVKITPATQSFARQLKKAGIVDNTAWNGGYDIWNPSGHATQNISSKEEGAVAYARHLEANGVKCYAQSRLD